MRKRSVARRFIAFFVVASLVLLLFAVSACCARKTPGNHTDRLFYPDEIMRQELALWMYENGTLPVGDEPELVDNIWGYSYAYTPYLPTMLSSLVMRLAPSGADLCFAARLISVAAYALLLLYAYLLGRELFRGAAVWCFSLVSVALPQAFFCGLYMNNDIVSLLSCYMIAYCMVAGKRKGWNVSSCVHLGFSLAVCALTYYFAYGWILAASLWCLWDGKKNLSRRDFRRRVLLAAGTAFLLAGWYFIRNAVLYHGDFFGISTQHRQAELQAATRRDIHFGNPGELTWDNLLFWLRYTFRSFFAGFGPMTYWASDLTYTRYSLWLLVGSIPGVIYYAGKGRRARGGMLLALIILPLFLSLYRSFSYDWQYQGRYLFSAWPAVCILVTKGYLLLGKCIAKLLPEKARPIAEQLPAVGASACFIALSIHTVIRYLLPICP